jgi:hypothetical protein
MTDINRGMEATDPEKSGNSKPVHINKFRLRGNFFHATTPSKMKAIVYTELNCVVKSPLLKKDINGNINSRYQPA